MASLFSVAVFAVPNSMTFQSKIYKPDGVALESAAVNFRFTTMDPTGTCILYVEDFTNQNMLNSGGLIVFELGNGSKVYPPGPYTLSAVFDNLQSSFSCQGGGTYSPGVARTDMRKVIMQFNDGWGAGWQTLPAVDITSVPYANYAGDSQKFGGLNVTDFLRFSTLPTCLGGAVLTFNGASVTCVTPVGSGGTVTSVSGTAPIVSSGGISPTLSINNATTTTKGAVQIGSGLSVAAGTVSVTYGTTAASSVVGNDSRITGAAQKASNLSDLASAPSARTNLGLGGAAVLNVGTGTGTVAAGDDSRISGALQATNNLSDVTNATSARTNLGLGTVDSPIFTGVTASGSLLSPLIYGSTSAGGNLTLDSTSNATKGKIILLGSLQISGGAPGAGKVLTSDATGNVSWATSAAGSVTSVSVTSANGFSGSVATSTTTPAITIGTSITGVLKGDGTAISAATSGTDFSAGTFALGTGIIKSTTGTGALTIAVAGDFPTFNQNTNGNAATATLAANVTTNANLTGDVTSVGNTTTLTNAPVIAKVLTGFTSGAGTVAATDSILQAFQKLDGNITAKQASGSYITSLNGDITATGPGAATAAIGTNKVTNTMLAQVTSQTFLGRTTAATGNVENLTATQATAMFDLFTASTKGLTPASGGGATNFLRADGTWAAPSGSGDMVLASVQTVTGAKTFGSAGAVSKLIIAGATSGQTILDATAVAGSGTVILPTSGTLLTTTGSAAGLTSFPIFNQNTSGTAATATLAANVTTNANLTGDVTSVGNATTLTNAPVIAKVLTGFTSGAGTVAATDSILQAFQKLDGNITAKQASGSYITSLNGDITATGPGAATAAIGTNKVTNTMLAQVATQTFLGRTTAATGNVETLTATQATAMFDLFTATTKGLTPASGGGATNFLRADGTWATPGGSGDMVLSAPQTVTGAKTFGSAGAVSKLIIAGATSGQTILDATAAAGSGTVILPTSGTLLTTTGSAAGLTSFPTLNQNTSGTAANATLAANVTTNANLTGDVTSVGNATTLTNAPVIAKVLTGFTSGAGTVAATDSILQAFQKLDGNITGKQASGNYITSLNGDITATGPGAATVAIGTNKVTNSMLATVATQTFLGRTSAATGNIETLTATQATAMFDLFTATTKGLAPASGGGATNFLRADGTWAAPSGSGDMVLASIQTVTGAKTFGSAGAVSKLIIAGATSGQTILDATAVAGSGTVILPTSGTLLTTTGSAATLTSFPTFNQSTTGNAANVTGVVAIANGGTGTATAANNLVFAGPTSGGPLAPSFRALAASDIPSLSSVYLPLTGGTLTGALINNTNSASTALAVTQSGAGYAASFMGGNVGIGTAAPNTALDINGAASMRGMAAPAVSVAAQGRIYFDSTSNTFKVSQNNGAYSDLATAASVGTSYVAKTGDSMTGSLTTTGSLKSSTFIAANGLGEGYAGSGGVNSNYYHTAVNDTWLPYPPTGENYIRGKTFIGNDTGVITTAGNVGIGTTTPAAKLSIGNNVATGFLDNYSEYQLMIYDGTTAPGSYGLGVKGNTMVFNSGAGAYSFDAAGSATRMVIDTTGNVGIGTTSPANTLHVVGTSATPSLRLGATTAGYHWDMGRENATTGDFIINNANGGATTEKFRISVAGNISTAGTMTAASFSGAGTGLTGTAAGLTAGAASSVAWSGVTSKPTAITQIQNLTGAYGSINIAGVNGGYAGINFVDKGSTFMVDLTGATGMYRNSGSWQWYFDTNGALAVGSVPWSLVTGKPTTLGGYGITDAVTSSGSAGNIPRFTAATGIGNSSISDDLTTVTAAAQVDVTGGTGTAYNTAPIEVRTTATPRIAFHWPGVVAAQLGMDSGGVIRTYDNPGTGYAPFAASTGRFTGEVISTSGGSNFRSVSGNFGIFDYSDGSDYYKLLTASGNQYGSFNSLRPMRINLTSGDMFLANANITLTHASGNITTNGTVTSTAYYYTSDRRLKTNIVQAQGLETILKLNGVNFDWIANGNHEIGLIAQDVEKVLPELVKTDEKGFKSVKYGNLVAPLIESTKELYGMSKMSEKQIAELSARLTKIDRRLASVENQLEEKDKQLKKQQEQIDLLIKEVQNLKNKK